MLAAEQIDEFRRTGHLTVKHVSVLFHHGNTPRQASANRSPRRAAAFHYLLDDASLIKPALNYDPTFSIKVN